MPKRFLRSGPANHKLNVRVWSVALRIDRPKASAPRKGNCSVRPQLAMPAHSDRRPRTGPNVRRPLWADHVIPIAGRSLLVTSEQRTLAFALLRRQMSVEARGKLVDGLCVSSMLSTNPSCPRPKSPVYLFPFRSRLRGVRNRHGRGGRDAVDAAVSGVTRGSQGGLQGL